MRIAVFNAISDDPPLFFSIDDKKVPKEKFIKNEDSIYSIIHQVLKANLSYDTYMVGYENEVQCDCGCRRSSGDIYLLLKYYFPDKYTLEDVMKALYFMVNTTRISIIFPLKSLQCCDIEKRVFWVDDRTYNWSPYEDDEYGLQFYEWSDL